MQQNREGNATRTLAELADISTGIQSRGYERKRTDRGEECDARLIQARDVTTDLTLDHERLTPLRIDVKLADRHRLQAGQVLFFGRVGQRYAVLIEENAHQDLLADKVFFVMKVKEKSQLSPEYLAWFLNSDLPRNHFNAHESGSVHGIISKATLGALPVPLPDLEVQKHIGEAWACWRNKKRAVLDALNSEGELIAARLERAAWGENNG